MIKEKNEPFVVTKMEREQKTFLLPAPPVKKKKRKKMFADDLALLYHARQHIQETTRCLSRFGQQVGLQISERKTESHDLEGECSSTSLA